VNNTDKLLRAFIEAQGYEIEVVDSGRKEQFGTPIIDYKVTKRESLYLQGCGSSKAKRGLIRLTSEVDSNEKD